MACILVYTSPARGHLYPILGPATELASRGHDVRVVTLDAEVELVRGLGLGADAMDPAVEAREMDDYKGRNPKQSLERAVATFGDRGPMDRLDLRRAIASHDPDVLIVDNNSWGALAAAEGSGLPWCAFQPYFTPLASRDAPPFGPGLPLAKGPLGRLRDRIVGRMFLEQMAKVFLPVINEIRGAEALDPVVTLNDFFTRPPLTIYFTAEPLEYPRSDWPESYVMVGPATWNPPSGVPDWLVEIDRPIVLVTCSTERQGDSVLLQAALDGLADEDVFVVGTSAGQDPNDFDVPSNARVERFLPHDPICRRAAVVVCHGGMGITQRALAGSVPVVVVPFGRDQLEVARRVEHAGAGVRLSPRRLTPERIAGAVDRARRCAERAGEVAKAFNQAGGDAKAADLVEGLLPTHDQDGQADSAPMSGAEPSER